MELAILSMYWFSVCLCTILALHGVCLSNILAFVYVLFQRYMLRAPDMHLDGIDLA